METKPKSRFAKLMLATLAGSLALGGAATTIARAETSSDDAATIQALGSAKLSLADAIRAAEAAGQGMVVGAEFSIKDGKQQELPMDRLSAGERQLLAISVLSALIKERKGRFPVVVDTPLARLDQHHRSALIKRFFATVSHQVVVLSTDQEVDGAAYEALKPFTNAEYSLDFDDGEGRTTVNSLAKEVL